MPRVATLLSIEACTGVCYSDKSATPVSLPPRTSRCHPHPDVVQHIAELHAACHTLAASAHPAHDSSRPTGQPPQILVTLLGEVQQLAAGPVAATAEQLADGGDAAAATELQPGKVSRRLVFALRVLQRVVAQSPDLQACVWAAVLPVVQWRQDAGALPGS